MDLPAGPDKLSAANDANPFPRLPATLKVHVEYHHANGMTKDNMELPLPYQAVRKVNGNVVSQVSITQDFEYWLPSCGLIMMDALDPSHSRPALKKFQFTCLNCTRVGTNMTQVCCFSIPLFGDVTFKVTAIVQCGLPACYLKSTEVRKSLSKGIRETAKVQLGFSTPIYRECANQGCHGNALPSALKQCGKCRSRRYCSRDCQCAHWPKHKDECTAMAAARLAAEAARSPNQET